MIKYDYYIYRFMYVFVAFSINFVLQLSKVPALNYALPKICKYWNTFEG